MITSLSNRGYGIPKKNNDDLINKLKKELTVSPNNNFDANDVKEYAVYLESDNKL
jgi:hypothetical protein